MAAGDRQPDLPLADLLGDDAEPAAALDRFDVGGEQGRRGTGPAPGRRRDGEPEDPPGAVECREPSRRRADDGGRVAR